MVTSDVNLFWQQCKLFPSFAYQQVIFEKTLSASCTPMSVKFNQFRGAAPARAACREGSAPPRTARRGTAQAMPQSRPCGDAATAQAATPLGHAAAPLLRRRCVESQKFLSGPARPDRARRGPAATLPPRRRRWQCGWGEGEGEGVKARQVPGLFLSDPDPAAVSWPCEPSARVGPG